MKIQSKSLRGLMKKDDMYKIKVNKMCVEVSYSANGKCFNDCMLNILKRKLK